MHIPQPASLRRLRFVAITFLCGVLSSSLLSAATLMSTTSVISTDTEQMLFVSNILDLAFQPGIKSKLCFDNQGTTIHHMVLDPLTMKVHQKLLLTLICDNTGRNWNHPFEDTVNANSKRPIFANLKELDYNFQEKPLQGVITVTDLQSDAFNTEDSIKLQANFPTPYNNGDLYSYNQLTLHASSQTGASTLHFTVFLYTGPQDNPYSHLVKILIHVPVSVTEE